MIKKTKKPKCVFCKKKLGVVNFKCKCEHTFCTKCNTLCLKM